MAWPLKDKVCIVGLGETEYTRWGRIARSEFQLACEAILAAVADAGVAIEDVDGFVSYASERQEPIALAGALGIRRLRFESLHWGGGGGGGSGAVATAAAAIHAGLASYVVVYRSLAQGQFGRFGLYRGQQRVSGESAFRSPYGFLSPPQTFALPARRHMHEYGTTSRQFGAISVAARKHAQRNPRAVMYGRPITLEDHQNSRMIADPYRLLDCCLENDGAAAVLLASAERARDLQQRPVYLMGTAMGANPREASPFGGSAAYATSNQETHARELYARAGVGPEDIDVAQIYENFTGQVLMSIEDHGFCARGEGGPFVEGGRIEWPDGELPVNTSGGNLAEAYIHGFELVNEAARQMRGTSTCQVDGAEVALVASGPGVEPTSDLILRR
jgi:acetyl-CoA acetyltransferase